MELSDDFQNKNLGMQWSFWKENARNIVRAGEGKLILPGKGNTLADGRLMLITPQHKNYEVKVTVQSDRNAQSGLLLFYNEKGFTGVTTNGKNIFVYVNSELKSTKANTLGKSVTFRIHNKANKAFIYASNDGKSWMTLAENIELKDLNHNNLKGFYALRPALAVSGKGKGTFKDFYYSNAMRRNPLELVCRL